MNEQGREGKPTKEEITNELEKLLEELASEYLLSML